MHDRLQREALKQAAVDPATGKIDISILTTGISGAARKQRAERAQLLKELIRSKGKVVTLKYVKLWEEFRERLIEKEIEKVRSEPRLVKDVLLYMYKLEYYTMYVRISDCRYPKQQPKTGQLSSNVTSFEG